MYSPIMKEHMQYIIDHAEEIEKLLKVKAQVSEVKSIMLENIDKVRQILLKRKQIPGLLRKCSFVASCRSVFLFTYAFLSTLR